MENEKLDAALASPSLLGVRGDTVDMLITWLDGRRGKNTETTLTLLERKVAKLRQPMVDAQKPSWYI